MDSREPQLDLGRLEQHLWGAANILRGPVDQADFKSYIFPLLFFKRISDVWDEEYAQALEESGGDLDYASFAENHRFQIPEGAHWSDVREKVENVGLALQNAMRQIEMANPQTLYGIFGDTQWSNKDRLPDSLLRDLIEHFSKVPLGNANVAPDLAGQAYRVPHQTLRRPLEEEGRRVLHPTLRRSDDGQHPRPDRRTNRPRFRVRVATFSTTDASANVNRNSTMKQILPDLPTDPACDTARPRATAKAAV
jgi:hypothetical protein